MKYSIVIKSQKNKVVFDISIGTIMTIDKKYIWIINWIGRSSDSVEPTAQFDFENSIPRILRYSQVFRLLNSLQGLSEISRQEFIEKGWTFNLSGANTTDLIEELDKLNLIQYSTDKTKIEFLKTISAFELFLEILQEESFGNLNRNENIILEIFYLLKENRFLSLDAIFLKLNNDFHCGVEEINKYYQFLIRNNLIEIIENNDGVEYLISKITSYGDFKKTKELCNKVSTNELELIGEAIDYIDQHVGIIGKVIPQKLKEGISLCINNGVIHPVQYNFGTNDNQNIIELLFPSTEEFAINSQDFGQFDKFQSSIGMIIYATKISYTKIKYPKSFVNSLFTNSIKVRDQFKDMFRQYSPMVYSGMINFERSSSDYQSPFYNTVKTYRGLKPVLLNSEENRDILRRALSIIENNEQFPSLPPSSITNLKDSSFNYQDTAGRGRTIKRSQHVFDIILNRKYRSGGTK